MTIKNLSVANVGDAVEARDLPRTTIRTGWGWVRTLDGDRSVYVVNDATGTWIVRDVQIVEESR